MTLPLHPLLTRLGLEHPIIQAPMAGVSTPEMAAKASNAGALGSLGVGAASADQTRAMIDQVRASSDRALNVNLFCNRPAQADPARERAWLDYLSPRFAAFGAKPPATLHEIYGSFLVDQAKLEVLLDLRPAVVSFHFGLPSAAVIAALKDAGILLIASATSLAEGDKIAAAGLDAVVAQGWEAGGHRGVFDPAGPDDRLGTLALTRLLVRRLAIPVIASGGIMDGAGVAAALSLGAVAAQLGTAFVACPESSADPAHIAALLAPGGRQTTMTTAISGRPARSLVNAFTALGDGADPAAIPDYPIAYDAGKALNAAAKAAGDHGYGAQWAGQAAALSRALPTDQLIAALCDELAAASAA